METSDVDKIKRIENIHVFLWLVKDMSWCNGYHHLGMLMVIPTLAVALKIAWHARKNAADLVHNCAVCLWISANITWMVGEFFYQDHTRPYARVFFFAGMLLLLGYYAKVALQRISGWYSARS